MGRRVNGEGTIYFDQKHNRYEGQFQYEDPQTGFKKKKKLIGNTKILVARRGKEFIRTIKKQRMDFLAKQNQAISVANWLVQWMKTYIKSGVRLKTYERYICSIEHHIVPYIGEIAIDQLKTETVQDMLNNLLKTGGKDKHGLSPRTVNAARRTLKSAMEKAYNLRMINYNPVNATKACKTEKAQIIILDNTQAKKLLTVAKKEDYAAYIAILLALTTGMRLGEIFGLMWENVDMKGNKLYVKQSLVTTNHGSRLEKTTKTKSGYRQIDLPKYCITELEVYKHWQDEQKAIWLNQYDDQDVVVSKVSGGFKDPSRFSHVLFKRLLKSAGISTKVRFHDLRHTHATWLLEKGVNPKIVAERLGHSSIRITLDTYSHVIKGMQQIAVDKIDEMTADW